VRHNVMINRIYEDGNQLKDSKSFSRDDLALVMKGANMAHDWIFNQCVERLRA